MGAEFQTYKIKAELTTIKEKVNDLRQDCRYDHGHAGYTGTIAEDNGNTKVLRQAMDEDTAEDYIADNAKKWESSIAIPILGKEGYYLVGGVYSC